MCWILSQSLEIITVAWSLWHSKTPYQGPLERTPTTLPRSLLARWVVKFWHSPGWGTPSALAQVKHWSNVLVLNKVPYKIKSSSQDFEEWWDSDITALSIYCQLTLDTFCSLCQLVLMPLGDSGLGYVQIAWYHVMKVPKQSLSQVVQLCITVILILDDKTGWEKKYTGALEYVFKKLYANAELQIQFCQEFVHWQDIKLL